MLSRLRDFRAESDTREVSLFLFCTTLCGKSESDKPWVRAKSDAPQVLKFQKFLFFCA